MSSAHLAFDLGASSGRAIIGCFSGQPKRLKMDELLRFEHLPCPTPFGPVWDLTGIWLQILNGLKLARKWCQQNGTELKSIGIDAWGVDWCLVGKSGELLMLPHCYRDPQNDAACNRVVKNVGGREALYRRNGIQLMSINTLFQVAARNEREPGLFEVADQLLFVPDLFHFWLTGSRKVERTIASTSAMLEINSGDWDKELLKQLGIPLHLFGPIIEAGDAVGTLREELALETGLSSTTKVISPASHDTAAAVAAVPSIDDRKSWAYLSSGTWSLLGAELREPFVSHESCLTPFTNERGFNGTVRFLKNIAGLWLVQELRRELVRKHEHAELTFAEMAQQARTAEPFRTIVNPNDPRFASPGNMTERLQQYSLETNQPNPVTVGELVRCCLDSLALSYRETVNRLETVLGKQFDLLHIVGGGIQNDLLNELTVNALDRPVICGPVEATAIGNLIVQAIGCDEIADIGEARRVVAQSFELKTLTPDSIANVPKVPGEVWARFLMLPGVDSSTV